MNSQKIVCLGENYLEDGSIDLKTVVFCKQLGYSFEFAEIIRQKQIISYGTGSSRIHTCYFLDTLIWLFTGNRGTRLLILITVNARGISRQSTCHFFSVTQIVQQLAVTFFAAFFFVDRFLFLFLPRIQMEILLEINLHFDDQEMADFSQDVVADPHDTHSFQINTDLAPEKEPIPCKRTRRPQVGKLSSPPRITRNLKDYWRSMTVWHERFDSHCDCISKHKSAQ